MSKEILVDSNRFLKLKNVLELTIDLSKLNDENNINKKIKMFDDYIKNHNLNSYGPLVISTNIIGGDSPKILMKLVRQIKNIEHKTISPYEIKNEFKTENCVYSHFEGNENDVNIAQLKMQVYAYEHDLVLDTICYLVYILQKDDFVKVDTFIPILGSVNQ